jgi:hypothetical protein
MTSLRYRQRHASVHGLSEKLRIDLSVVENTEFSVNWLIDLHQLIDGASEDCIS